MKRISSPISLAVNIGSSRPEVRFLRHIVKAATQHGSTTSEGHQVEMKSFEFFAGGASRIRGWARKFKCYSRIRMYAMIGSEKYAYQTNGIKGIMFVLQEMDGTRERVPQNVASA